jgi:hypothetical protein
MMRLSDRLIQLACDPERWEELVGDLTELGQRRAARIGATRAKLRQGWDILSVCVRQSRFRDADLRRVVIALAAGTLLAALLPDPGATSASFVVNAKDPAGEFTLEIEDGRLVSAMIDGTHVSHDRLKQHGDRLTIVGGDGDRDLSIELQGREIRWEARAPH